MEHEKSCGALVYCKKQDKLQLLVLRHKMGGHWSFPKGHVEQGENEIQTALREIKEETGLNVEIIEGFRQQVAYSPRPSIKKQVVYFLAYAKDTQTTPQEDEISEIQWIDFDKTYNYLTYDNDRRLVQSAKRFMKNNRIK